MRGSRISPEKKAQALAMRLAGYTLAVIAQRTDISARTLVRLFKACETKPEPISDELVSRAREALLDGMDGAAGIRLALAASIADDLEQAARLREKITQAIDALNVDDHVVSRESARALVQLANALKTTQVVTRTALGVDGDEDTEPLTVLEIREFTPEEIADIRARHNRSPEIADCD